MNGRSVELDIIKAVCILGIIFTHAGHDLIWFGYFFLFGFYFVGGITYHEKPFLPFLISKVKRIYVPFVCANIFAEIICSFLERVTKYSRWGETSITYLLKFNITEAVMAPSWYLLPLFCISFIFIFLEKVFKSNIALFLSTFCICIAVVHYRNVLQGIVWNNCAIVINLGIGLFLYTCGYLYNRLDSVKNMIESKHAFDFFIISIVLLCEAKYYWNYSLDLRAGIISNGKWMFATCAAGIYFLLYFSKMVTRYSVFIQNILVYIGKRSMSLMFFHVLSFSIVTLIGIYVLKDSYTVSWTNAFYDKWYYRYANAFVGLMTPLFFDSLLEKIWSAGKSHINLNSRVNVITTHPNICELPEKGTLNTTETKGKDGKNLEK